MQEKSRGYGEYHPSDRFRVKERMPDLIIKAGLFQGNERRSFSPERGGVFRCPVCGRRIGLYRKNSPANPWGINGFGHCTCFSDGYSSDIFGLYAAIEHITERDAFRILMEGDASISPERRAEIAEESLRRRNEAERKETETQKAMKDAFSSSLSGDAMPLYGKRLLATRGIDYDALPVAIRDKIGYLKPSTLSGRDWTRRCPSGITFRLDNGSYQLRIARKGKFTEHDEMRFLTAGQAYPFNSECITSGKGPLLITEGPFDAVSAVSLGFVRTAATAGAGNISYIVPLLESASKPLTVFIGFDDDTAGKNGTELIRNRLNGTKGISIFKAPLSGGQGDLNALLIADRAAAKERTTILLRSAELLEKGIIDNRFISSMMAKLLEADRVSSDAARKENEKVLWQLRMLQKGDNIA